MKRLILVAPLAVLAACGSSRGPESSASAEPIVYASSARPAADIARCLDSRLSRVHVSKNNGATDLTIGSSSNGSYFITLTPRAAARSSRPCAARATIRPKRNCASQSHVARPDV
jgi:hypothetical protein